MKRHVEKRASTAVLIGGGSIFAGREIMLLHLARGLRSAGWQAAFITTLWGGEDKFVSRLIAEKFQYFRIRLGFISIARSWKPFIWTMIQLCYWPALALGYLKAIKASAPDVVIHTNWHHALLLMPFLDRRRDLYWSHEVVLDKPHYAWIFRAIAKRVTCVVCVSDAVARSIVVVGVPQSKVLVVHNGIDTDTKVPPPRTQSPLRLGVVGQIGAWKGHEDVLDALALLPRGRAVLKIFGSGQDAYVAALKDKARHLQIGDLIEWRGFVADSKDIYGEIDICLIMSRSADPFPTVALEAGMAGRPVICTPRGGLPEIVEKDATGFLVESNRPDLLAAAIDVFAQSPELITIMGQAARKRVETEFSRERFVRSFLQAMEHLER